MIQVKFECKKCKTKGDLSSKEFIVHNTYVDDNEEVVVQCDICGNVQPLIKRR